MTTSKDEVCNAESTLKSCLCLHPQEHQRLMVEFNDYPNVLLRMLNQCIREPHIHLAVYVMQPTGEARLDFIQVGGDLRVLCEFEVMCGTCVLCDMCTVSVVNAWHGMVGETSAPRVQSDHTLHHGTFLFAGAHGPLHEAG